MKLSETVTLVVKILLLVRIIWRLKLQV